jgi:glycosyltransferase involved in cell wall biosynthesis
MTAVSPETVIVIPANTGHGHDFHVARFARHWARLLRQQGDEVSVLAFGHSAASAWPMDNVPVRMVSCRLDTRHAFGNWPFIQCARQAAEQISHAGVIYWADWQAGGFHALRARRFRAESLPVHITVLHGGSRWLRENARRFPDDALADLSLDYGERYSARHSDYVAAPSHDLFGWAEARGWVFPPGGVRVMGYPYVPPPPASAPPPAAHFRRLIYHGDADAGLTLFGDSLRRLRHLPAGRGLSGLAEILLMIAGNHDIGPAARQLEADMRLPVRLMTGLDAGAARDYLAQSAPDSLAVIPGLDAPLSYTVLEASLIPGLNALYAASGGIAEALGQGSDQLFTPDTRALADRLWQWLAQGPRRHDALTHYDWQAANDGWLALHAEAISHLTQPARAVSRSLAPAQTAPPVDICIPFYNHGRYLPQLLAALEHQTRQDFNVFVVDDASTDPASQEAFARMAERYAGRGWRFQSNPRNLGVSHTRNILAALGQAEYILFVDADNVPAPRLVERFLDAMMLSGDDCLTCYLQAFEGDAPPYDLPPADPDLPPIRHARYVHLPLGDCLELGMFANVFGDTNLIVRRSVFVALGGFTLDEPAYRYITGEDHAFLARLVFGGYRLDVVPEFLFYYRHLPDSLSRTTSHYQNMTRVLNVYRQHLGLEGVAPLAYGLHVRAAQLAPSEKQTDARWLADHVPWYVLRDAVRHKLARWLRRWRG